MPNLDAMQLVSQTDRSSRILLAEDDDDIGFLVTEMLSSEGFEVITVQTGDEGTAIFDSQLFQLLLTDVRMPGTKDGLDLAAHALKQNPTFPVVIVSGFAEELGARLTGLGASATFLRKPFTFEELISTIRHALLSTLASAVMVGSCQLFELLLSDISIA